MKKSILLVSFIVNLSSFSQAQINPPQPVDKGNGIYTITIDAMSIEIDSKSGGRISSLKLKDREFLYTAKASDNWGSTFWTSPQSAWGWPPSENINSKPYTGRIDGLKVNLTSNKDDKLGLVINKKLSGNLKDTSFSIVYTITNVSQETKQVAPWEITRVAPGGLTIFPSGKSTKKGDLVPLMKDSSGITWFKYQADKIPAGVPKYFSDGSEGWIAQVSGNMILIKTFKDVEPANAAPDEAEIELYANPDKTYIEIEQQGDFTKIDKGSSSTWEVKWYIRSLPKRTKVDAGNMALIKFIRNTIK